jgi:hypothetical protein
MVFPARAKIARATKKARRITVVPFSCRFKPRLKQSVLIAAGKTKRGAKIIDENNPIK